ncbi:RRP15-like protein [Euphorbia peplus]|nr:RRP15-like protein [Euphorbia peplus]
MASQLHMPESVKPFRKRKVGHKKGGYNKGNKKQKQFPGMKERVKMDPRIKKMLQKKARDYNSDDDDEEEINDDVEEEEEREASLSGDDNDNDKGLGIELDGSEQEDEDDEILPGITKLAEGCRAFRTAFQSIMAKTVPDDSLGPVLSGHQKLLVEKLAEEETGKKVKREAKKEKHLMEERGHVKPANYLDTHEKFLISVATKGVVKLFNAVNKAQNAQKGLDPSRTKDAKVIKNRRKQAFFSELGKTSANAEVKVNGEGPSWAPLRDNYMLTNSKLKDWDRKQDTVAADDIGKMSEDSGSDDD